MNSNLKIENHIIGTLNKFLYITGWYIISGTLQSLINPVAYLDFNNANKIIRALNNFKNSTYVPLQWRQVNIEQQTDISDFNVWNSYPVFYSLLETSKIFLFPSSQMYFYYALWSIFHFLFFRFFSIISLIISSTTCTTCTSTRTLLISSTCTGTSKM